jgi:hypothetical protein
MTKYEANLEQNLRVMYIKGDIATTSTARERISEN